MHCSLKPSLGFSDVVEVMVSVGDIGETPFVRGEGGGHTLPGGRGSMAAERPIQYQAVDIWRIVRRMFICVCVCLMWCRLSVGPPVHDRHGLVITRSLTYNGHET